jgi:ornithine cyclodeaminase/alanine dehydrogenase-like protein (mu-crystallin family)
MLSLKNLVEQMQMLTDEWSQFVNSSGEIGEYSIMEEFSENYPDAHIRDCLCIAISGKGAFRRFKDTVIRFGIQTEWYAYRDAAFLEFA